jgi:rSAM/selenodomain-associated transferase 1
MSRAMAERIAIAVMARAPFAGQAKSRLIPALGAEGAAALQARLIERTVATAASAGIGPVTLWTTPDETHPLFRAMRRQFGVALARQPDGDLGARMHAAVEAAGGGALVIGTDCPALTADHLHLAAATLRNYDVVVIPADDGGYVLIGLRQPRAALFEGIEWGTATVMAETRRRLQSLTLSWRELPTLWDVDTPEDLERLRRENLLRGLTGRPAG